LGKGDKKKMPIKKIDITKKNEKKKAEINLKLSEFEIPPMRDILILGKRAPIGPEAAKRMADAVSPECFVLITVNDKIIEALLVKKTLLQLIPQEHLIPTIIEESRKIMRKEMVIKIEMDINISVTKIIEL
jgi:hypothetical protein